MAAYRLPLFPLRVVLFPEQCLPLHIFEERYKIMIGERKEENAPFGIVLAEKSGIHKVGCAARVIQLLEKFPDGRMNILTRGERRFELFRTYDSRPCLEGEAGDVHDEAEDAGALCRSVWDALKRRGPVLPGLPEEWRSDPFRLSFALAEALRLSLPEKQAFLESRSPRWRLKRLLEILENQKTRASALNAYEKTAHQNGRP